MADRGLTSAMESAILSQSVSVVFFLELDFTGGISRYTSAPHDVSWNSQTWSGVPVFTGMGNLIESMDMIAQKYKFFISGVPSEQISNSFTDYQGRSAKFWFGVFDSNGAVIVDPALLMDGEMEFMVLTLGVDTNTIHLTISDRIVDLGTNKESLYTHIEQDRLFSGDKGLEYIDEIQGERQAL